MSGNVSYTQKDINAAGHTSGAVQSWILSNKKALRRQTDDLPPRPVVWLTKTQHWKKGF